MLRRKFCLTLGILALFMFLGSNKVFAGTCSCMVNSGRMYYVDKDNCDAATEYASCNGNNTLGCTCIKKENSNLKPNTCTCSSSKPSANNCQADKPIPVCETRSQTCVCTTNGSLISSETQPVTSSIKDPFAGCNPANSANPQINTALGCVPVEMSGFISWLLPKLFGVIGGISFLLIVYGFILVATSSGDPKKVEGARETITSAVTGLLVSIFALFLLRLIAVNILHIPGLN